MIDRCPLCDAPISEVKFVHRGFVYKRCRACRTIFVANPLLLDDLAREYSESYYEAASNVKRRGGYASYPIDKESLARSFTRKLQLVRSRKPSGRLLDAGAAYGSFLQIAAQSFTCVGLELSEYAAARAREDFHVDVRVGALEEAPFADDEFDVIVMWDVIEHLHNPLAALKQVSRMLRPGGYCFISTDDVDHWLVRALGKKWWGIAPPFHLCHFSKQGMRAALDLAGGIVLVEMVQDSRSYSIAEIIQHFGVAYQNRGLIGLGARLERTRFGRRLLDVARPEQFITIVRKTG